MHVEMMFPLDSSLSFFRGIFLHFFSQVPVILLHLMKFCCNTFSVDYDLASFHIVWPFDDNDDDYDDYYDDDDYDNNDNNDDA